MFLKKSHIFPVLYSCRKVCFAVFQNKLSKYQAHSSQSSSNSSKVKSCIAFMLFSTGNPSFLHKHKQAKESSCSPTYHTPALRTLCMKHFVRKLYIKITGKKFSIRQRCNGHPMGGGRGIGEET